MFHYIFLCLLIKVWIIIILEFEINNTYNKIEMDKTIQVLNIKQIFNEFNIYTH